MGNLIWLSGQSVGWSERGSGSVLGARPFIFFLYLLLRRRILLFEIAISHRSFARERRQPNEQPIIRTVFESFHI